MNEQIDYANRILTRLTESLGSALGGILTSEIGV